MPTVYCRANRVRTPLPTAAVYSTPSYPRFCSVWPRKPAA